MRKSLAFVLGTTLLLLSSAALMIGQVDGKADEVKPAPGKNKAPASPHEMHSWVVNGKKISVTFGRPYKKGRVIFGGLEPWGKVWRTGADEATVFATEADLMLGSLHVEKGAYSLFTIPNEKEWTLILNKTVKQWGAFSYQADQDFGRAPMKVSKSKTPIEQLTFGIAKKGKDSGVLQIGWDETIASIDLMAH